MGTVEAPEGRWCLTADGDRIVAEGDPDAATLFTVGGREVDEAEVERLGGFPAKAEDQPANKAVEAPEADKAEKPKPKKKRAAKKSAKKKGG